jgi:hypothetical protein
MKKACAILASLVALAALAVQAADPEDYPDEDIMFETRQYIIEYYGWWVNTYAGTALKDSTVSYADLWVNREIAADPNRTIRYCHPDGSVTNADLATNRDFLEKYCIGPISYPDAPPGLSIRGYVADVISYKYYDSNLYYKHRSDTAWRLLAKITGTGAYASDGWPAAVVVDVQKYVSYPPTVKKSIFACYNGKNYLYMLQPDIFSAKYPVYTITPVQTHPSVSYSMGNFVISLSSSPVLTTSQAIYTAKCQNGYGSVTTTLTFNLYPSGIIVESGTGGNTDPAPGNYGAEPGTPFSITAYPLTGYDFAYWQVEKQDISGLWQLLPATHADNPHTFTYETEMQRVTPVYEVVPEITHWPLVLDFDQSMGSLTVGANTYDSPQTIQVPVAANTLALEGNPAFAHRLLLWTATVGAADPVTATANPWQLTVTSGSTLRADFEEVDEFMLSWDVGSSGHVRIDGEAKTMDGEAGFLPGAMATVQAVPAAGFAFLSWTGDVPEDYRDQEAVLLEMDRDRSISPRFYQDGTPPPTSYALTYVLDSKGYVTVDGSKKTQSGSTTFAAGSSVAVRAIALGGYKFSSWSGDVNEIYKDLPSLTLSMNADRAIRPNFVTDSDGDDDDGDGDGDGNGGGGIVIIPTDGGSSSTGSSTTTEADSSSSAPFFSGGSLHNGPPSSSSSSGSGDADNLNDPRYLTKYREFHDGAGEVYYSNQTTEQSRPVYEGLGKIIQSIGGK